jgi:hypothetical protein
VEFVDDRVPQKPGKRGFFVKRKNSVFGTLVDNKKEPSNENNR